tara:strand:+ start:8625 stop:10616 length:1992 start_codon:yes stop_codon:yes gene_type:complete
MYLTILSVSTAQSKQDIERYRSIVQQPAQQTQINSGNNIQNFPSSDVPREAQIIPYSEDIDSTDVKQMYFGYNFFVKRDTIKFWENLPTPQNYLLGPGDELTVSLWGQTQLRQNYTISREGKIYDEKVGLLNLTGKTIEEAEKYFLNQFGRVYSTLKTSNPSTYMDVSMGKLKSINVNFVGEINYPGVYPVHPFSTVITGLIQIGGIDTTGSLRNIQIKRNNKVVAEVDLYDYLLKGNFPKDIQLRNQDIVVVPSRSSTIKIDSAVVRPGIYESKPGETVFQMINFAGGLRPNASESIGLNRIIPISNRKDISSFNENYYIDFSNSKLTPVQNGDIITVRSIFKSIKQVEIIGQVKKPGYYNFYDGMKLNDLVMLAGGFSDSSFWKSVYQKQGQLVRRNPNSRYATIKNIDLIKLLNGDKSTNIDLHNRDRFVVHANPNYFEKDNIQITGEVNIPGSYPLTAEEKTLESIIDRAGNFTSKANRDGISIFRDKKYFDSANIAEGVFEEHKVIVPQQMNNEAEAKNIDKPQSDRTRIAWSNQSILLMPGDSIVVHEATNSVNVFGEVYSPGALEISKGKSIKYYVDAAGGVTKKGDKNGIIVIYANGVVSPKKWYSSPKIKDGCTIVVTQKVPSDPFDLTVFLTNWTSIISSVITVVILSKQIGS